MDEQESEGEGSGLDGPSLPEPDFDWGAEGPSEGRDPDVMRFEVAGVSFAVDATHVIEVATVPALTPIPGLPAHVLGVAVRRRHVLSVVDLGAFVGLTDSTHPDRLLVLHADGIDAGLLVRNVAGPEVWSEDAEAPDLTDVGDRLRHYVVAARWAPGGRVLLVDLPEILRDAAVR